MAAVKRRTSPLDPTTRTELFKEGYDEAMYKNSCKV